MLHFKPKKTWGGKGQTVHDERLSHTHTISTHQPNMQCEKKERKDLKDKKKTRMKMVHMLLVWWSVLTSIGNACTLRASLPRVTYFLKAYVPFFICMSAGSCKAWMR